MKKVISLLLVISVVLSMTMTVTFAYENPSVTDGVTATTEEAVMYNSDGEELKFKLELVGDNQYKMEFYIEDELIRVYNMDMNSSNPIIVTDQATNRVSTMSKPEAVVSPAPASVNVPIRYTDLGYVHYARSSQLGAETCAAVVARSTDYYEDQYAIDTNVSRNVDALVTYVAGALIGAKLPVPTGGWLGVAQLLVEAAISAVGADIIGDVVSMPFKEYYYCTVTEYEVAGTVVGKGNGIMGDRASFTGKKYSVEYQSDVFNDSYEGYTPNTWRTTEFARDLWFESMPGYSFPGYIGFPATYPL